MRSAGTVLSVSMGFPMALTELTTRALVPLIQRGSRIASMGYPDIISPEPVVRELLGELKFSMLRFRVDSAKICKWHGLEPQNIPDSESFFDLLGAALDVYDIYPTRGNEILCDLNYPMPQKEAYHFVLDVGTAEHCFNIGQALMNMAGLLREGGYIFHGNPFVSGNHGFYGLNPTLFHDFYSQPGFQLEWVKMKAKGPHPAIDVPRTKRFQVDSGEIDIFAYAKRTEVREITYPMQTKYVVLAAADQPGVKGVENE